jgi:hypothetical protein
MRKGVLGLVLIAALVAASVAGASTRSSPTRWVATFCGAFAGWEQAAKAGDAKLTKDLTKLQQSQHVNLVQIRDQLASFLADFAGASRHANVQIAAVGAPSVAHGQQIQQTILSALASAATFLKHAKASVRKFPTGNAHAFVSKTEALAKSITATFNRVAGSLSALRKYKATQLEAAAKANPTCKKLGG